MSKLLSFLPLIVIAMAGVFATADQPQKKANKAPSADYTALEFLQFNYSEKPHKPNWPIRLTFRDVKMNLEEFMSYKQGRWDMAFHCNGQSAKDSSILIGDQFKRTVDGNAVSDIKYRVGSPPRFDGVATLTTKELESGAFEVTLSNEHGKSTVTERPVIVVETNEEAIFLEAGTSGECPNGKLVDGLYIKIPTI